MKNLLSRIPILVWVMVPTILLIIGGVVFFSKSNFGQPKEDTGKVEAVNKEVNGTQVFDIVSREHITSGVPGTGYNSDPPTSGPHWPAPAKNGVYDKELADEQLIHNLEHGHIWISYKPDVGEEVVGKLKEIVDKDGWKIVLEPRSKNQTKIVLAAWGRLLVMDEPEYGKIEDFIKTYRNRGPEKTSE